MYRYLLFFFVSCFSLNLNGQSVSINQDGSSPDPNAILDIQSADQGVLFPRSDTASLIGATTGLVIFDTIQNGFCVYNGMQWINLNADRDRIVDVDGDTRVHVVDDNQDRIEFEIDGIDHWAMQDHQLVPVNSGGSIHIGGNAGRADDLTSNFNVYLGWSASERNEMGFSNVSIGGFTGFNHLQGDRNVMLGSYAGHNANYPSRSIFLGYEAGYYEQFSDRLHIANSKDVTPLVYGQFDNQILRVGGNFQIRGPSLNGDKILSMANTGGTYDRILVRQPDNDIYFGDVDQTGGDVHFRADGDEWLTITALGNMGYGINNPDNPFHLHKRTPFDRAPFKITDEVTGSTLTDGIDFGFLPIGNNEIDLTMRYREDGSIRLWPNDGFGLAVSQTGRVGIGTRDPDADLHIVSDGGGSPTLLLTPNADGYSDGLLCSVSSNGTANMKQVDPNGVLSLGVGFNEHVFISSNRMSFGGSNFPLNTYLNISSPQDPIALDVDFGTSTSRFTVHEDYVAMFPKAIVRRSNSPTLMLERTSAGSYDGAIQLRSGGEFAFLGGVDGDENAQNTLMVLESNGELGIGTIDPTDALHVNAADGNDALRVQTNGATRMRIYANGSISLGSNTTGVSPGDVHVKNQMGLGVTAPSFRLQLQNDPNQSLGHGLAKAWDIYSDDRVKFEEEEIQYGLDAVLSLSPKQYLHASSSFESGMLDVSIENAQRDIGLIAQEVFDVVPEVVQKPTDESEALWAMDYAKLVPVLIKAIQEQQELIEVQQAQLELVMKRLDNQGTDQVKTETPISVMKAQ